MNATQHTDERDTGSLVSVTDPADNFEPVNDTDNTDTGTGTGADAGSAAASTVEPRDSWSRNDTDENTDTGNTGNTGDDGAGVEWYENDEEIDAGNELVAGAVAGARETESSMDTIHVARVFIDEYNTTKIELGGDTYAVKEKIKSLDWDETHRKYDKERGAWIVDADALARVRSVLPDTNF